MPNTIKYSTTGDTLSLQKGNWYIGVGDTTKGPTSDTGHWNGITPSTGAYTIYENKSANGPSIRVPSNSSTLIDYAKRLYGGTNINNVYDALNYLNGQTTMLCVNIDYESIITSGLTFCVDAGFTPSYPTSGTTWYNVSQNQYNGTLVNGPTFNSSNGGSIVFNGSNNYVTFGNQNLGLDLISKSFSAWVYLGSTLNNPTSVIDKQFDNSPPSNNYGGWGFWIGSDRKLWWWNMPNQDIRDSGSTTVGINVWCNVAVTYNASTKTASFYINGTLNSSTSNSNIVEQSSGTQSLGISVARLGQANQSGYLNGSIANVLAYNRVLSASEVLQNYNAQFNRFIPTVNANLVFNLDAANYSAMPTNGSTIAGTGGYAITMTNTNSSMSWNSANGGVFRKSTANTSDLFLGGPNYSSGSQAYSVFMAYKWDGGTAGRLLNANSASPDWLLGLWGDPASRMNIAFNGAFVGSNTTAADTGWHFIWMTDDGLNTTNSTKSYIATSVAPTGTNGTRNASSGFNGLRLFGRYSTATTSSEPVTGDVGFVKVWDGVLTLSEIQALHSYYKSRFGL
jgi:hypothetical protein